MFLYRVFHWWKKRVPNPHWLQFFLVLLQPVSTGFFRIFYGRVGEYWLVFSKTAAARWHSLLRDAFVAYTNSSVDNFLRISETLRSFQRSLSSGNGYCFGFRLGVFSLVLGLLATYSHVIQRKFFLRHWRNVKIIVQPVFFFLLKNFWNCFVQHPFFLQTWVNTDSVIS